MTGFKLVLWKELLDLSRDYRTLAAVILLPLVSLPSLAIFSGLLYTSQTASIIIVLEPGEPLEVGEKLSQLVREEASHLRLNVNITVSRSVLEGADVLVVIPRGFYENISRIDGQGVVRISRLVGSPASDMAYQAIQWALYRLSLDIVDERIRRLSEEAGVKVDPGAFRSPVLMATGYHLAGGAPAGLGEAEVAFTARILAFSLFFVVYPAIVFMSDSIVGERERRTIEKLLVTPLSRRDILVGKMAASIILGMVAALADSLAILAFFYLAGGVLRLSPPLAFSWLVSAFGLMALTSAITSIVASRSATVRSAQMSSTVILVVAMAVYFSALIVDLTKIPELPSMILQLIPFTHAALALYWVSTGALGAAFKHLAILYVLTAVLAYASVKAFNSEKLLLLR